MTLLVTATHTDTHPRGVVVYVRRFVLVCTSLALAIASPVGEIEAQEMPVPIKTQVVLLSKVLAFDRALSARPGESLEMIVVYQEGFSTSRQVRDELARVASALDPLTIGGKRVAWRYVDIDATPDLTRELPPGGTAVVYVTPLRGVNVAELGWAGANRDALLVTGVPEYVGRGAAVGIGWRGGRARVLVALAAARAAGADFSARLLQLADLVGR